jgi:hypothetical protein
LRKALVNYYDRYQIKLDADEIIITCGGSEAVLFAFMSCLNPGDEIIVPEPAYTNYKSKYKTATIDVDYSEYDTGDEKHGKRYIGVGYWNPKEKRGSGSPCDSLDEAVEKIQGYIRRIDEANEKVYELDIRGVCDDAYCPKCDYGFMDSETDAERCPRCGVKVSWERWHEINDEERKCCNNCNRYRMTVDASTCEPKYMICHRPGTVYGDQITNPESYVCECWEEKGESE